MVAIEDPGDEGTLVQTSSPLKKVQDASKRVQFAIGHFFRGDTGTPALQGKIKGKRKADKQLVPFEGQATDVVQADVSKELVDREVEKYTHNIALRAFLEVVLWWIRMTRGALKAIRTRPAGFHHVQRGVGKIWRLKMGWRLSRA